MKRISPAAREHWRQIVQEQKSSGVSIARFCRERQIAESTLFAWKRRLVREGQAAAGPEFVLVRPAPVPDGGARVHASGGAIELHLGRGRHLLLRPGFDAPTLAAALVVLSSDVSAAEDR
jgi:transposase-like protein